MLYLSQTSFDPYEDFASKKHIHPTPEPRFYGILFVVIVLLVMVGTRKKRK